MSVSSENPIPVTIAELNVAQDELFYIVEMSGYISFTLMYRGEYRCVQ